MSWNQSTNTNKQDAIAKIEGDAHIPDSVKHHMVALIEAVPEDPAVNPTLEMSTYGHIGPTGTNNLKLELTQRPAKK